MNAHPPFRDLAVAMLNEGQGAAEVWQKLTSQGMESHAAESLVREILALRAAASTMNAANPPVLPIAQTLGWDEADKGSFGMGLAGGLFLGCWALSVAIFAARTLGSETKKGIYIGFAVQVGIGLLLSAVQTISHGR